MKKCRIQILNVVENCDSKSWLRLTPLSEPLRYSWTTLRQCQWFSLCTVTPSRFPRRLHLTRPSSSSYDHRRKSGTKERKWWKRIRLKSYGNSCSLRVALNITISTENNSSILVGSYLKIYVGEGLIHGLKVKQPIGTPSGGRLWFFPLQSVFRNKDLERSFRIDKGICANASGCRSMS